MYKAIVPILLLAGAASAGPPKPSPDAAAAQQQIAKKLAGLVQGQPQDCISPSRSTGGIRTDDATLFQDRAGTLYLATYANGCSIRASDAIISRRPTDRLCRGDIIEGRDLTSGIFGGACTYSHFVPYRTPQAR